eukprot:9152194-Pyramimonas_sp.AAC.1
MFEVLPRSWTGTPYEEQGEIASECVDILERLTREMVKAGELGDIPAKKRQRIVHEKAEEEPPSDDADSVESSESEA